MTAEIQELKPITAETLRQGRVMTLALDVCRARAVIEALAIRAEMNDERGMARDLRNVMARLNAIRDETLAALDLMVAKNVQE